MQNYLASARRLCADAGPQHTPKHPNVYARRHGTARLKQLAALLLLSAALAPAPTIAQTTCDGPVIWPRTVKGLLTFIGIVPDCLSFDAPYRILFVTNTNRSGTSGNIDDYNAFVRGQAYRTHFRNAGINNTFTALVSTVAVHARDNTNTNPNTDGPGVPIFYFNGRKVADDYNDFYDGSWDTQETRSPTGFTIGNLQVFTGSTSRGVGTVSRLGENFVKFGRSGEARAEIDNSRLVLHSDSTARLYGLSAVLTVPRPADTGPPVFDDAASIDKQMYVAQLEMPELTLPAATGGDGPLSYTITPALPAGLTLTGRTLSGTPSGTAEGPTTYTYTVSDSDTNTATTDTGTLAFTIEIFGYLGRFTPMFSSVSSIPAQVYRVDRDIGAVILPEAFGTAPPLRYSIKPPLPDGLHFDSVTRTLSGTPAAGSVQAAIEYEYIVHDSDTNLTDFSTLDFTIQIHRPTPTATLFGRLTEANLFTTTVPTVTVTLVNAEYVSGLLPAHFVLTEDVAGTVSVVDVNRASDTEATLTLAYTNRDITTNGEWSVTVATSGHNRPDIGALATNTLPIVASFGTNICGRTAQVREAILAVSAAGECTSVGDLGTIPRLDLTGQVTNGLRRGDFAGLSGLQSLDLSANSLETLPDAIFSDLAALQLLHLQGNRLAFFQTDLFNSLTGLLELNLQNNRLTALPATIFDGLTALQGLNLTGNLFAARTGLPAGIFAGVLATLRRIGPVNFTVDDTVRRAHFVCSRPDFMRIVEATAEVDDCLRISVAQLNTALAPMDATLSDLMISAGSLEPAFDRDTSAYAVAVAFGVDSVMVTPTASQSDASITVNGSTVDSGSTSNALALTLGTEVLITMVVTAADTVTTATYTVTVTHALPVATLAASTTLTEANLLADPAPTVTVTLVDSEYAAADALKPGDFTLTDTLPGSVSVTDFTRNDDTMVTLTLAYTTDDILVDGTLSVTVAASGHNRPDTGTLTTNTVSITASPGTNICDRTPRVRDEILRQSTASECTSVGDLGTITHIDILGQEVISLQRGDFAGLSRLDFLGLGSSRLETLPDGIFNGLTALRMLHLEFNRLVTLPVDIFNGLSALKGLRLLNNPLEILPINILTACRRLSSCGYTTPPSAPLSPDSLTACRRFSSCI